MKSPPRLPPHKKNIFDWAISIACTCCSCSVFLIAQFNTAALMRCFRRYYVYCCRPEMNTHGECLALCYLRCCDEYRWLPQASVGFCHLLCYYIVLPKGWRLCYGKFLNAPIPDKYTNLIYFMYIGEPLQCN